MSQELALHKPNSMESAILEIVKRDDISPERLEKFLDLQIKMDDRQAKKDLSYALAQFQKDCPIITKKKETHNSKYASLDEIIHKIKPILAKHELSYSFNTKRIDNSMTMLTTTIRHAAGAEIESFYEYFSLDEGGKMNNSQRLKSALTYARRAGIEAALGLAVQEEDDDAIRAIDNPITNDQITSILELCRQTETTSERFLEYLKISSLDDLSFDEAKTALTRLMQKRKILVERQAKDVEF